MTVAAEFGKNNSLESIPPNPRNSTLEEQIDSDFSHDFMVDENHSIIDAVINDMTNQSMVCPPDAICSYGMHGGLTLFVLFVFFLGTLAGWAMHTYSERRQKKIDEETLADPRWNGEHSREDVPKGYHSFSINCDVYGCDGNHV